MTMIIRRLRFFWTAMRPCIRAAWAVSGRALKWNLPIIHFLADIHAFGTETMMRRFKEVSLATAIKFRKEMAEVKKDATKRGGEGLSKKAGKT